MPSFIGTLVPKELNQTVFKELYEFLIDPPPDAGFGSTTLLPAKVPLDLSADESRPTDAIPTYITKNLAQKYGALEEGDLIELVLYRHRSPRLIAVILAQRGSTSCPTSSTRGFTFAASSSIRPVPQQGSFT